MPTKTRLSLVGLLAAALVLPVHAQDIINHAVSGLSGLGTGVATALGINIGSAGAPVTFNGAGGTPSSITLTNGTGLPIAGTTGYGAGVATALGIAVGSAGGPVTNGGALGTPSSGTLTNATGLPVGGISGLGTGVGTIIAAATGSGGPPAYTTGTWTPTLIGSTSGTWTVTGASTAGSYEQIGRQVTVRFTVVTSASNSPVGNIQVGGLPFTSTSTSNDNGSCTFSYHTALTNSASFTKFSGLILTNSAVISVFESGSGQSSQAAAVARGGTNPSIIGSCFYRV